MKLNEILLDYIRSDSFRYFQVWNRIGFYWVQCDLIWSAYHPTYNNIKLNEVLWDCIRSYNFRYPRE